MVNLPSQSRNALRGESRKTRAIESGPSAFLSMVERRAVALFARRQEPCKNAVNCGAKEKCAQKKVNENAKHAEIPQIG